jgi:glycerophosphoryl diester phosphodiesterase
MRLINLILLMLILFSCEKKENYSSIQVIGHAGMGLAMTNAMYHDNSKESIEYALLMNGCDGVEVDVQLSKDGDLWLYHDPNLESETNGSGCISESTSEQISTLKYKSLHQEKLCRLKDLDSNLLFGKKLYLDIRKVNFCANSEISSQALISALEALSFLKNPEINVVVVSSNLSFLNTSKLNGYQVAYEINDGIDINYLQQSVPFIKELIVKNNSITTEQILTYESVGISVTIFEMRSASGIRKALRKNPASIMTDDLREAIIEVY